MKNPFSKEKTTVYQVVEVEKPRQVRPFDKNVAESLQTLQGHPGFMWLLEQCRLERAYLKTVLSERRQASLEDVAFLQAGVAAMGWLQDKMDRAIGYREGQQAVPAMQSEREAFEEASKFIEVLR